MNEMNKMNEISKYNKGPYLLSNWSVICTTKNIHYKAPELYEYSLQGQVCNHYKFHNDTLITSSSIKDVNGLFITTISNSIYKLEGPPHEDYQKYCSKKNIIIDKENPIKIIGLY